MNKSITFTELKKILNNETIVEKIISDTSASHAYKVAITLEVLNAVASYLGVDLEAESLRPTHVNDGKVYDVATLHKFAHADAHKLYEAMPNFVTFAYVRSFVDAIGDNDIAVNGVHFTDCRFADDTIIHSLTINNYGFCHDLCFIFEDGQKKCDMWIANNTSEEHIINADYLYASGNITLQKLGSMITANQYCEGCNEENAADATPISANTKWRYDGDELRNKAIMDIIALQNKFMGKEITFEMLAAESNVDEINYAERCEWEKERNKKITSFRIEMYGVVGYVYFNLNAEGNWGITNFDVFNSYKTNDGNWVSTDEAVESLNSITLSGLLTMTMPTKF